MAHSERSRIRWYLVPLAALLAVAALVATPAATSNASAPASCDTRANDTIAKLLPCITQADLWQHMKAFQRIADQNPGPDGHPSRNSGEPGYKASVDYVARKMRSAGYDVTIQRYKFFYFAFTGVPVLREDSPSAHTYTVVDDWDPGQASGSTTATLQPAGGIVLPPTATSSSTSGCTPDDFNSFTAGNVALIQRGGCNYGVKVQNAQAAGATGVVIFNEGNPGRTDVIAGSLLDAAGNRIVPTIPVAFTSFATGDNLYQQATGSGPAPVMTLNTPAVVNPNATDYNVIADSKGGSPNHVVVVDAHLDAIYGAGMLDNASGSAAILDIAEKMKNAHTLNKMRYIWFGGEELGLLGSQYYVNNLSPVELRHTRYDLDADVFGTPNYLIGILDPAGPDLFGRTVTTIFPKRVYQPSKLARDRAVQYFKSIGLRWEFLSPTGTDAYNFNLAGVPASGLLTGQDCCKSQHEVNLFGGYLGNYEGNLHSFDGGCVDNPFRWCDNLNNVDPRNMTIMTKAFATMVVKMAYNTSVVWSNSPKYNGRGSAQAVREAALSR